MAFYQVFLIASSGMPRDHHSLFVETNNPATGAGHIFQVTGNIQQGMLFEDKPSPTPPETEDPTFISKSRIGVVASDDYPDKFCEVCLAVPAPVKQYDGPRRIYPNQPLLRCQEWTAMAITALVDAQILRQL